MLNVTRNVDTRFCWFQSQAYLFQRASQIFCCWENLGHLSNQSNVIREHRAENLGMVCHCSANDREGPNVKEFTSQYASLLRARARREFVSLPLSVYKNQLSISLIVALDGWDVGCEGRRKFSSVISCQPSLCVGCVEFPCDHVEDNLPVKLIKSIFHIQL